MHQMTCNNLCLTGKTINSTERDRQCRYKRNIVLHNHCCHGKVIHSTYSDCTSIALIFRHANSICLIKLPSVTCLAVPCRYTLSARFSKKKERKGKEYLDIKSVLFYIPDRHNDSINIQIVYTATIHNFIRTVSTD